MVCGVVTGNAAPASVASPAVQSISSSFVLVTWSAPEQPNGLVTEYLVERRLILDDGAASDPVNVSAVRVVVPADHYEYLDQSPDLRPRTTYEYRIRYDTIRDAISTCAQKLTRVSFIYRTEDLWKRTHSAVDWSSFKSLRNQNHKLIVSSVSCLSSCRPTSTV